MAKEHATSSPAHQYGMTTNHTAPVVDLFGEQATEHRHRPAPTPRPKAARRPAQASDNGCATCDPADPAPDYGSCLLCECIHPIALG